MMKLATVLPTKMVQRKFSGFSRKPCNTCAERRPARICCRMRNRLNANTPASMPDNRNDSARQRAKSDQIRMLIFTGHSLNETPNYKHQTPKKHQAPSSKESLRLKLELGVWSFSGAWFLVFGAFYRHLTFTSFTASTTSSRTLLSSVACAVSLRPRQAAESPGFGTTSS